MIRKIYYFLVWRHEALFVFLFLDGALCTALGVAEKDWRCPLFLGLTGLSYLASSLEIILAGNKQRHAMVFLLLLGTALLSLSLATIIPALRG